MQVQRQIVEVTGQKLVIELPESFVNHRIELIALTLDDDTPMQRNKRTPHPAIAGKGKTVGDLIEPIVDESEWNADDAF